MRIDEMGWEWQHLGDNDWVFGKKVRGIVRESMAEVYFNDEGHQDKYFGWVWFIRPNAGGTTVDRGVSHSLRSAVETAEIVLEKILNRNKTN